MGSTSVSVVIPRAGADVAASRQAIEAFLGTTGFTCEVITPDDPAYGNAVRRGVADARGTVVVVVDPRLPYPVSAIGDAIAMVDSGGAEVVFGSASGPAPGTPVVHRLLKSILPDAGVQLMALSAQAAAVAAGESRLPGRACELEIAFLANKYGFRVEILQTPSARSRGGSYGLFGGALAAMQVRLANRRSVYRVARRCPVCFSAEVWSRAQLPGNVVRSCRRCKCRFLNQFAVEEGGIPVRRVLRSHALPAVPGYEFHAPPARERTSLRRYNWLHRQIPSRARILEVGVRDGSFGILTSREYEYVGIDPASAAARQARLRGLEVYCATLSSFVNTGPPFDAITLFHVFENMPDPHDALGRIKELLKPGGLMLLSAFDTEGLIYLLSERKRMAQNFRTHLILYSRSALIELLEHSGFEIIDIGPDFEYRDHRFVRHWFASHHPRLAPLVSSVLALLPDPAMVSTGSIRIVARRRSGPGTNLRAIRSVEPTHAR